MAWTEFTNYSLNFPTAKGTLVSKQLGKPIPIAIPIYAVVPSSPGAAPAPKVCQVPAGFRPLSIHIQTEAQSASAGVGLTATLGDSGSAARLMAAQDWDAANSFVGLAVAASNYEYTADTDIVLTINTGKTPTAGAKIWGAIYGTVRQ